MADTTDTAFAPVIRYGVVAREEAYLERNFDDVCRYRARVRRWLCFPPRWCRARALCSTARKTDFRRPQRACFATPKSKVP